MQTWAVFFSPVWVRRLETGACIRYPMTNAGHVYSAEIQHTLFPDPSPWRRLARLEEGIRSDLVLLACMNFSSYFFGEKLEQLQPASNLICSDPTTTVVACETCDRARTHCLPGRPLRCRTLESLAGFSFPPQAPRGITTSYSPSHH